MFDLKFCWTHIILPLLLSLSGLLKKVGCDIGMLLSSVTWDGQNKQSIVCILGGFSIWNMLKCSRGLEVFSNKDPFCEGWCHLVLEFPPLVSKQCQHKKTTKKCHNFPLSFALHVFYCLFILLPYVMENLLWLRV